MPQLSTHAQLGIYFIISNILPVVVFTPIVMASPSWYAVGMQLSDDFHMLILWNWIIAAGIALGKGLQHLLFGPLRAVEVDHIYRNSGMSIINSLLALAMFSDDLLPLPVLLSLYLQFVKVFHWILHDRFDHLFQNTTNITQVLKSRNLFALVLFLFIDFKSVYSCVVHSFGNNPDVYFAFGFQFVVLFLDLTLLAFKTIFNTYEIYYLESHPDEEVLEGKDVFVKVLDLVHTSSNLMIDFFLLFTFIGPTRFPVYLFQSIFSRLLRLIHQVVEFRSYLKASRELDSSLNDATQVDLDQSDILCIICRDDMTLDNIKKGDRLTPKKLHCGHIIHIGCLKSWFERSQVCPLCRAPVLPKTPIQAQAQAQTAEPTPPTGHQTLPLQREATTQQPRETPSQPVQNHLPHENEFFHAPLQPQTRSLVNNDRPSSTPATTHPFERTHLMVGSSIHASSHAVTTESSILRLPRTAMLPPDWTILKLTKPSPGDPGLHLQLNSDRSARVRRRMYHPKSSAVRRSPRTNTQISRDAC